MDKPEVPGIVKDIQRELILRECCKIIPITRNKSTINILELNLSYWHEIITEDFLSSITATQGDISLIITDVITLRDDLWKWLYYYISPKLISVCFNNCSSFTWKIVKKFLEPSSKLQSINFKNNNWVNDQVVEQISQKYAKTITELNFERSKITDNALFQIGKKCQNLRTLSLECCPGITNSGLIEISRRIHLSELNISHNMSITDVAIEKLFSNANSLYSIKLNNCPKLTDRSIASLYEAIVTWGKKRNTKAQTLKKIDFTDNNNVTYQLFNYIATAIPGLLHLDFRDCENLDLAICMHEIENLEKLEELYIGPSGLNFQKRLFISAILYQLPNLKILHLQDLPSLTDEDIGEILSNAVVLEDLTLIRINFSQLTIEAICSNIPNISKLTLIGSNRIIDTEIRCLCCICINITSLTIQHCPQLTDAAFNRCYSLKQLTALDISYCSMKIQGLLLSYFNLSKIRKLSLNSLNLTTMSDCITNQARKTYSNLNEIYITNCSTITTADVQYILSICPFLCKLDVTECHQLLPTIEFLSNPNPFLSYYNEINFLGFKANTVENALRIRSELTISLLHEHHCAHKIQIARKQYLQRIRDLELQSQLIQQKSHLSIYAIYRIHRICKLWLKRKKQHRERRAAILILKAVTHFLLSYTRMKIQKSYDFYRNKLYRRAFKGLVKATSISYQQLVMRAENLNPVLAKRLKNSIFSYFKNKENGFLEKKIFYNSKIMWEGNILNRIMAHWKTIIGHTIKIKTNLVKVFMNTLPLTHYNSTIGKINVTVADHFYFQRLLIPAWCGLLEDYRRFSKAKLLTPVALKHFHQSFLNRVVKVCYKALLKYSKLRKYKRIQRSKGSVYFLQHSKKQVWRKVRIIMERQHLYKLDQQSAKLHFPNYKKRLLFQCFPIFQKKNNELRKLMTLANHHQLVYSQSLMLKRFVLQLIKEKLYRQDNIKAHNRYMHNIVRNTYFAWRNHAQFMKHTNQYVKKRYQDKLKLKMINILRRNVFSSKDYLKKLSAALEEQSQNEFALRNFIHAMTTLQARARMKIAKRKVREYRADSIWAAQVLQNFSRRALAMRELGRRKRLFEFEDIGRQLKELELMREEEAYSEYYQYCINAIIGLQRAFRGWKGRVFAKIISELKTRQIGQKYYATIAEAHDKYEQAQREMAYKMLVRHRAAAAIQAQIRGILGRRRFLERLRESKRESSAIRIQQFYRRHLYILMYEALKRDHLELVRYRGARKQQGLMLRVFFNIKKRKNQRLLLQGLHFVGFDPFSFRYNIRELLTETYSDFRKFLSIMGREKQLFRKFKGRRLPTVMGRKQYLENSKIILEKEDAVRVILPGHKFYGYTGIVVKIDPTLPGNPLYEIKLDHFSRQCYVQMSREALELYYQEKPLDRIDRYPKIFKISNNRKQYEKPPQPDFGYTRTQINRVEVIQQAYRRYRAKKISERKRYEFWTRAATRHWSLIDLLQEKNALTTQAYNITGMLRLRTQKMVLFDEIRHEIFPSRIKFNGRSYNPGPSIRREFYERYKQRVRFLEKAEAHGHTVFADGWLPLHFLRKISKLVYFSYGMVMKGGKKLTHLGGHRGTKYLAGHKSLVVGLNKYYFDQFEGSPHVRFPKATLYQGEWNGIPLFTKLRPHGMGLAIFFDCWGYGREDRVLKLTVKAARQLIAGDIFSSDAYCDIFCNGKNVQTTVKYKNLNPIWHEYFEIDVTDPHAVLKVKVMDKDYISSDDFLGQVIIYLADIPFDTVISKTYLLKGPNIEDEERFDRGEIDLELHWCNRYYEDEFLEGMQKVKAAIRIQAWTRLHLAKMLRKLLVQERDTKVSEMLRCVVLIQCLLRLRLARKEYRRRLRRHKAAIKIQLCARQWLARRALAQKRLEKTMAIKLQCAWLCYQARCEKLLRKIERQKQLRKCAVVIQKTYRRQLALQTVRRLIIARRGVLNHELKYLKSTAVSEWIKTYGRDPEYGLRRNRRIVQKVFNKLINTKYSRLATRYGDVFVDSYPPSDDPYEEGYDDDQSSYGSDDDHSTSPPPEPLTVRSDFIQCLVPKFVSFHLTRHRVLRALAKIGSHTGILHLHLCVNMKRTVEYSVIAIQCFYRLIKARRNRRFLERMLMAIIAFQRLFRRHNQRLNKAAFRVQSMFKFIKAIRRVRLVRLEKASALKIQSSWRCYVARCVLFDILSVEKIRVLHFSSSSYLHEPDKCLDFRSDTFWMSQSAESSELCVEFRKQFAIDSIWILCNTFAASPKFVSIGVVINKKSKKYDSIITDKRLPKLKGERWHCIRFKAQISKYFKVSFAKNYGDELGIGVRQIRFLRARERSVTILMQPAHIVMKQGPPLNQDRQVVLTCIADGWPLPTFQWQFNGVDIPEANQSNLNVTLTCPGSLTKRRFRCIKCKKSSQDVPFNAYDAFCSGCKTPTTFKEITEYSKILEEIRYHVGLLTEELGEAQTLKAQILLMGDGEMMASLPDVEYRIDSANAALEELVFERLAVKAELEHVNRFIGEGLYTCLVQNIRGGSVVIKKVSKLVAIAVEDIEPFSIKGRPVYIPRIQRKRQKWSLYSCVLGTFTSGVLEGIVTIRFQDKSTYEGPYISEDWLDSNGHVIEEARPNKHWGIFTTSDGRVFEGNLVDNHFDPENIQGNYKLTLSNGDVYEGDFVDERFHGIGTYSDTDGNVYDGQWHCNKRYGHGRLKSSQGWVYEGQFENGYRNGDGLVTHSDGSVYIGEWFEDSYSGSGIFISRLHDVYKGDFLHNEFNGRGEMLYNNGSSYVGEFKDGKRHGKGIFTSRKGIEYFGDFINDYKHGEMIIKEKIQIRTRYAPKSEGDDNKVVLAGEDIITFDDNLGEEHIVEEIEVRTAMYDMGKFISFTGHINNPLATERFVQMFETDKRTFTGVYSLLLAKYLPKLPPGIDGNHPQVARILRQIRADGGMLIGVDAKATATAKIAELLPKLKALKEELETMKSRMDGMERDLMRIDIELSKLLRVYRNLMEQIDRECTSLEHFWMDERSGSRARFYAAVANISKVKKEDWFKFKNHRAPPPFLKKVMDGLSLVLQEPKEWLNQQMLCSDNEFNGFHGDEDALRQPYDCKLIHILSTYDIYQYCHTNEERDIELSAILADTRFRCDSYYVESLGEAAPHVVTLIKTNYAYIRTANTKLGLQKSIDLKLAESVRLKLQDAKMTDEKNNLLDHLQNLQETHASLKIEIKELTEELMEANDILKFIDESELLGRKQEDDMDYYELMERKLEEQQDKLDIEACLEAAMVKVLAKKEIEKIARLACNKDEVVDEWEHRLILLDNIREEVDAQQSYCITNKVTLGFSVSPEENPISMKQTLELIEVIVNSIIAKINAVYHEPLTARNWIMLNGQKITCRFLYITVWKIWKERGILRAENEAVQSWEAIFGDKEECARMAVQARVNWRMSDAAREQAKLWMKRYPKETAYAERVMAAEFAEEYSEDTAQVAIRMSEDTTGAYPPPTKAAADCWMKLNPEETTETRNLLCSDKAKEFASFYGDQTIEKAFKLINGFGDPDDLAWTEYAEHWKTFHFEEYAAEEENKLKELAEQFVTLYPKDTHINAAKIIEEEVLSRLVVNEKIGKELWKGIETYAKAKSWGILNQGLLRTGTKAIRDDHDAICFQLWKDLVRQTDDFQKGSFLFVPAEAIENPSLDRFLGFRGRLLRKFALLYGYLLKHKQDVQDDLGNLILENPMDKVQHNIRPSEAEEHRFNEEKIYLKRKKELEIELAESVSRLASWNSYFGPALEEYQYEQYEGEGDDD